MVRQVTDLVYNEVLRLDLYLVDTPGRPLVTCLHGGGFHSGSKTDERCKQAIALLTEAGFNCASISYSLASREQRFSAWPRNLFDVADALDFLSERAPQYGYDFERLAMLGYSAGCCLSNLYIQGGNRLFEHFGYRTRLFKPKALVGFYGPYDFAVRQAERRSDDPGINRYHSPAWWLRNDPKSDAPPVLHIQGDRDDVVYPDQHEAFQRDYQQKGQVFIPLVVEGFGHSFCPVDSNDTGTHIDLRPAITDFFSKYV